MLKNNDTGDSNKQSCKKKLWKRSFFYFICLSALGILTAVLAFGGYTVYFYHFKEFPPPPDVSTIQPYLKNGDIILRSGTGFWSASFRNSNPHDKRFSHVGIVLTDTRGKYFVIHAEGDDHSGDGEVAIVTLEKFIGESIEIGASRLHAADPDKFAAGTKKYLGRPFDWKFDAATNSAIYCTELVELALQNISPNISLKRNWQGIIVPESCLDPRYFTEITLPAPRSQKTAEP